MSDEPKDDDWGMTMPHMRFEKEQAADDFADDFASDPYAAHQPPGGEWGATVPNLNLRQNQSSSAADFDQTAPNINIPKDVWQDGAAPAPRQASADDWAMSDPQINLPRPPQPSRQTPPPDEWGATAPNINLTAPENRPDEWGMTAPNVASANVAPPESRDDSDDWAMNQPPFHRAAPPSVAERNEWSMPAPVFRRSEGEKVDNLPKHAANFESSEANAFEKTVPQFNFNENPPPGIYGAPPAASAALHPPPSAAAPPSIAVQAAPAAPIVEKGGGSKMIYALGGLIGLLFFSIVGLAGVYFFVLSKPETASIAETPKEQPKETATATSSAPPGAPLAAPLTATPADLPQTIDYKGAMVLVAAGEFTMGSDRDGEESKPAHPVTLPAFYIDRTEVTNAEYKKFCDETGKSYPPDPHLEKNYFTSRPNAPVVGVSYADAKAYAAWAGKRLPTEAEWEKAASWDDSAKAKRAYPWGDDFRRSSAAFGSDRIADVGKFADGASPNGALDMAGNVLEWVDAYFQPYPNGVSQNAEFGEKNRVVRGGHFGSKSNDSLKTTKRIYVAPDIASGADDRKLVAAIIGFRCAVAADDAGVQAVLNRR